MFHKILVATLSTVVLSVNSNLMMFHKILVAALSAVVLSVNALPAFAESWENVLREARGQTVYFNAWGGSEEINAYLAWVGKRVREAHGVDLRHVKLANTSDAVSRVLAEKTAGRTSGGSVDLIWINGENFAAMKQNGLLFRPFVEQLPNFALVDTEGKPTTVLDFHVPTDGLEAPWGMAKFNFAYDSARVTHTPDSIPGLLAWAKAHPGRFTYPHVSDFLGSTFLLQALMELTPDSMVLRKAVKSDEQFREVTAPLWSYLEKLHPHLWRKGTGFPANNARQRQMLDDGEVDLSLSFNPADTSAAIASGALPETARTFVLKGGTIGNTHFVAIPFNSSSTAGARVVANFLMSPEAQARKQHPDIWGDGTVLDLTRMSAADRHRFDELPRGIATLPPDQLGLTQPNPHPDWKNRIDAEWLRRYGQ